MVDNISYTSLESGLLLILGFESYPSIAKNYGSISCFMTVNKLHDVAAMAFYEVKLYTPSVFLDALFSSRFRSVGTWVLWSQ